MLNREFIPLNSNSFCRVQDDQSEVVLSLSHLQGAFYLLALGCVAAALGLVAENLAFLRLYGNL